jgi:lipid-binding SYLF domain-containing protein
MSRATAPKNAILLTAKHACFSFLASLVLFAFSVQAWGGNKTKDEDTLINARGVLQGMLFDKNISRDAIEKAECIVVLPEVKKVGLVVGGSGYVHGWRYECWFAIRSFIERRGAIDHD